MKPTTTEKDNLWQIAIDSNHAEIKKSEIPNTVGHTRNLAQPAQFDAYEIVKKAISLVPADVKRETELTMKLLLLGTKKNIGASEWTIDLSGEPEQPKITEAQIEKLLEENPLVRDLTVLVDPNLKETWDPDFKELNQHFQAQSISMPYLSQVPKLLIQYRRKCDSLESAIKHLKSE